VQERSLASASKKEQHQGSRGGLRDPHLVKNGSPSHGVEKVKSSGYFLFFVVLVSLKEDEGVFLEVIGRWVRKKM
jgi:hypothetical protein